MAPFSMRPIRFGALGVAVALVFPAVTAAQIPDTFTNLRVLPAKTERGALIGMMRAMTGALGVRCGHCHVGEDPERLVGMDFASDEKELKRVARAMMRMTRQINQELLPGTGQPSPAEVRCVTCHRGLQKPETLEQTLRAALESGDVDVLVAHYRDLRERYYGEGAYDFGERTLAALAEELSRDQKADAAFAVLELNLEHFPDSGYTYTLLGELKLRQGQTAGAIAAFERALEIDPGNARARQRLASVKPAEADPRTPPDPR